MYSPDGFLVVKGSENSDVEKEVEEALNNSFGNIDEKLNKINAGREYRKKFREANIIPNSIKREHGASSPAEEMWMEQAYCALDL